MLLHQGFEIQARRSPEQIAVVDHRIRLSYSSLEGKANNLAKRLISDDIKPNEIIAVAMERGCEQAVAVLGILKAGGAYLPIDIRLPADRIRLLLTAARVERIITQSRIADKLDWLSGTKVIQIDAAEIESTRGGPVVCQNPTDLAYVIFTSGSTGTPKGVMIDHAGPVNTIQDINRRFSVGSNDKILALSSLSFDLSVYDLFGILSAGGTVVMPPEAIAPDPSTWWQIVTDEGITIWNSVPALFQLVTHFLEGGGVRAAKSLRLVLLSGDWIPLSLPNQIRSIAPASKIISLGGATEASIWSILFPIAQVDPGWRSIPYGLPMENQQVVVLDEMLEVCPTGIAGNLYIGGVGLAKGYLNEPCMTKDHFITHPRSGDRLYRTGDLGRYFPDGTIEFLGRADNQFKYRGHRIEPKEVETHLRAHPAIRDVIVLPVEDLSGDERLAAYYILSERDELEVEGLRQFLQSKIPCHMIPSFFLPLKDFPLTENGKVDRKALPRPLGTRPNVKTPYLAPRTEIEELLCQVWREVLGLDLIGVNDDFFTLGGDSVLCVRVSIRARHYNMFFTAADIFTSKTVANLSQIIRRTESIPQKGCQLVGGNICNTSGIDPAMIQLTEEEFREVLSELGDNDA